MKIVVIEDHALMRDLLLKACREALPASKTYGARDAQSGLEICQTEQPHLVILDLALPDRDGLELLHDLLQASRLSKVIGVSGYSDEYTLFRAWQSKLNGFVDKKEQSIEQLSSAIKTVLAGERYMSPEAHKALQLQRNDPLAFSKILSAREQELLGHFGRGSSNEEIAATLRLSELTVRNHRCRTMAKLGLRTSAELVRYALEKGFTRLENLGRAAGRSLAASQH